MVRGEGTQGWVKILLEVSKYLGLEADRYMEILDNNPLNILSYLPKDKREKYGVEE